MKNNGGDTDYYQIDKSWTSFQDVIEAREMNYAQGNIFKVACTFNIGRHEGTNYERELNKIIWFANRELKRIKSEPTFEQLMSEYSNFSMEKLKTRMRESGCKI